MQLVCNTDLGELAGGTVLPSVLRNYLLFFHFTSGVPDLVPSNISWGGGGG
jgi:hypothetical protein